MKWNPITGKKSQVKEDKLNEQDKTNQDLDDEIPF